MSATVVEALSDARHALDNWSDAGCKVALRELVAALSSPPADDVREAGERLSKHAFHGEYFHRPSAVVEVADLRIVLNALTGLEARLRGTVTDADDATEVAMSMVNAEVVQAALDSVIATLNDIKQYPAVRISIAAYRLKRLQRQIDQQARS